MVDPPRKFIDKVPVDWGYVDAFWMVLFSLILLSVVITSLIIFSNNSIREYVPPPVDSGGNKSKKPRRK